MDVKLIVVSGKTGTKEIFVRRPKILGRAKGIGIIIPHASVSDRHCLLFDNNGLLMIQDLNSAQGTHVGGRKIVTAPLPPGAEFTVGPLTFRAEYSYPGNLNALPKTLYAEAADSESAAASSAANDSSNGRAIGEAANSVAIEAPPIFFNWETAEHGASAETATPSAGVPEKTPPFFGLGNHEAYPAAAQQSQQPKVPFNPPSVPIVQGAWADEPPNVAAVTHIQPEPPTEPKKEPPESVDDDLSKFLKKLE